MTVTRSHFLIISAVFLVIHVYLATTYGVRIANDTPRYLEWAENSGITEIKPSNWSFWYLSYVLFITPVIKTGGPFWLIIAGQVAISFVAMFCIYLSADALTKNKRVALITTLATMLWIEIPTWNFYILTESLFTSMMVISFYALIKTTPNWKYLISLILLFTFTVFIRPMGATFLIATICFLFWKISPYLTARFKYVLLGIAGLFGFTFMFFLIEGNLDANYYYSRGQIVWGAEALENLRSNHWLSIDNSQVVYPSTEWSGTYQFLWFTFQNFGFQCELFLKKSLMFAIHVKPYYSFKHNLFIAATLPVIYALAIYGIGWKLVDPAARWFAAVLFLGSLLMVGLTVEAWDGRFLIPVLPILFILGGVGLHRLITRIQSSDRK